MIPDVYCLIVLKVIYCVKVNILLNLSKFMYSQISYLTKEWNNLVNIYSISSINVLSTVCVDKLIKNT